MSPIRVLCVFSSLDRGGAETMCMNLYRHIDRSKVQFDFVKHVHEKGDFEDEIKSLGGKIYEAPRYKIYNSLQYKKWWKKHLTEHPEHQIVHGHFFTISSEYFDVARKLNRITIGHSHSAKPSCKTMKSRMKAQMMKKVERLSTYCLACSKEAGEWLFPNRRFYVLKNAINAAEFSFSEEKRNKIRSSMGLGNDLVVGHVGNIAPVKNQSFLIDVFKLIHDKHADSKLLLVGNGDQKALREKVHSLRLDDQVIFTGARGDVPDLLQAMDVFAFPSISEGLGIVAVEAQAAGLRTFCSDTVPMEVNVTNQCAFLSINNPNVWAESILKADLTRKMTTYLIKTAGYDIHITAKWLQEFYIKAYEKANKDKIV